MFLIFAIYRSKVNTSLKNKICFENIFFPSKFIKLCPESLKEHTDKISLSSDETQTFYWSFKHMSNYHLKKVSCKKVKRSLFSIKVQIYIPGIDAEGRLRSVTETLTGNRFGYFSINFIYTPQNNWGTDKTDKILDAFYSVNVEKIEIGLKMDKETTWNGCIIL